MSVKRMVCRVLGIDGVELPENRLVVHIGLMLAVIAFLLRLVFWWYTGRVWEDALITVLHSENFVNGLGLTHYRVGEAPLHGFTSPLSVLIPLMGDLIRVGFGLSFIKIVSLFAGMATVLYAMGIAIHPSIRLPKPLAILVMGYLACEHNQILWGMSGMETQMVTLVLLMSFYFTITLKPVPLGISLGLCMLGRPDFAFWTVISGLYVLIRAPRKFLSVAGVALVVYAPWIVFTTLYYGSPLPNTIVAKGLGYQLWTVQPGMTWRYFGVGAFDRLIGTDHGSIFQSLTPSCGGHGTFGRLFDDWGLMHNFMSAMALMGTVAACWKRQWSLLPIAGFVWVYAAYYAFAVGIVFGWYLIPFVAAVLFLSARGLQAFVSVVRPVAAQRWVLSGFSAAYVGSFVVFLPFTFQIEKHIQEDIENTVRKPMGIFLGKVMGPEDAVGCEPLGYVGYYSRRTVYDWPGLANRKVVEFSKTHPDKRRLFDMLAFFKPEFLALRYGEYANNADQTWIDDSYIIITSFEVNQERVRKIWAWETNIDRGFLVLVRKDKYEAVKARMGGMLPGVDLSHDQALAAIASHAQAAGQLDRSIEYCRAALKANPNCAEAYNTMGLWAASNRMYNDAKSYFEKALSLKPNFAEVMNNLGAVCLYSGLRADASAWFEKAMEADAAYAAPHSNMGNLYAIKGDFVGAEKEFTRAHELDPHDPAIRLNLQKVKEALKQK